MGPGRDNDAIDAAHATRATGQPLTRQRREILEHLGQVARELAEVYRAALWLLEDKSVPARGRLLAHCARELINRLPDYLDVPITTNKVQYEDVLDGIAVLWKDETHKRTTPGHLACAVADESSVASGAQVTLSNKLHAGIDRLVKDHLRSRTTTSERVASVLQPRGQSGTPFPKAQLEVFVHQWKILGGWFAGHAHVPNPGGKALDFGECERRFETLEHILYTRLCAFYGAVEELDDILEEANRPTS